MSTSDTVTHNPAGLLLMGAGKPSTAVILLHGRVGGPDGPVVGWLRRSLHAAGYSTLSLENPVPATGDEFVDYQADVAGPDTLFPEAGARIAAAALDLKQRGCEAALLCGFSMGARMTAAYLASNPSPALPVKGFIAIGIGVNGKGVLDATTTLGRVRVPVIDVCGAADGDVAETAGRRAEIYRAGGGSGYASEVLPGQIGHDLAGAEAEAGKRILTWLSRYAPLA